MWRTRDSDVDPGSKEGKGRKKKVVNGRVYELLRVWG
jgi:hypothetical protein